jgi:hypothetical protein
MGKEICRQSREVARARICVPLAPRAIEFERHDVAIPGFCSGPRGDAVNGMVDWCPLCEGSRRIKYVKWRAQELAARALREDDAVGWRVKVRLKLWNRTEVARRVVWWAALYGDDSGLVWDRNKLARAT